MALRVRFQYMSSASLGYSIERLTDGMRYDFSDGTFKSAPATGVSPLTPESGDFLGRYSATLASTPVAQFSNGDYAVGIHNTSNANQLVGLLNATLYNGDDAPVFPSGSGGGSSDPWSTTLPGSYAPGTAGYILGQNLDARVSSRSTYSGGPVASVIAPVTVGTVNDKSGYSLSQAFPANFAALTISPTGAVTVGTVNDKSGYSLSQAFPANFAALTISPTGAVTVGTVNDKSGYSLTASGLDAIPVESGVNVRQALSPILAAAAGAINGAGTGTIIIQGGNVSTTRITATTDSAGNRSTVLLSLPT